MKLNTESIIFRSAERQQVEIMVSGDLCPTGRGQELIKAGKSKDIALEIAPVTATSDLSIVQFESPLVAKGEGVKIAKTGPNLKAIPESVELLKAFGFDVALLANNHTGDFGATGVTGTIRRLKAAGLKTVGAGKNLADARTPLEIERNGLKITIMNVAEHEYGTATDTQPGVNPLQEPENIIDIMRMRRECDVLLVVIHGGNEYNPVPSPHMKSICRAFADAGAGAVINIHPHCPQGIEYYNNVPIIYSLGNFYFPLFDSNYKISSPMWWTGYSVKLRFDRNGVFGLEVIGHTFKDDSNSVQLLRGNDLKRFYTYLNELSGIASNDFETARYFNGWCAFKGPDILNYMIDGLRAFPVDYSNEIECRKLLGPRNLHTCESANELITHFLRLIEERRIDNASVYIEKIKHLQNDSNVFG